MTTLAELPAGRRRIADGTSGLPLDKVNDYRIGWGMDTLAALPDGVVVRKKNQASEHVMSRVSPGRTAKPITSGPGTELKKIFEAKGVPPCQACNDLAVKMDAWGVAGCRERLEEIIDDMVPRAQEWIAKNRRFISMLLPDAVEQKLVRPRLRGYATEAIDAAAEIEARRPAIVWEYGVTTVPERRDKLLPQTLASLKAAGFGEPRLFADGASDPRRYDELSLPVTTRHPRIKAFANWVLSMWELYARNPNADRYAIFQDDIVAYRNLREYLDHCDFPERGYWNLFTFMENERRIRGQKGWVESSQNGRGALALVFNRDAVMEILSSVEYIVRWPQNEAKGDSIIDGQIVKTLRRAGWTEHVHSPTLVDHTGQLNGSMSKLVHPLAKTFRGEDFDALDFLI